MPQPSSPRQRQLFCLFILSILFVGNTLTPCLDHDTWWHLRVGQFIVTERTLPDPDPFSQLGQQERTPWVAYSWLYEVALFEAFSGAGFDGILLCRHALDLLSFCGIAWILFRHCANNWIALLTLAIVTPALLPFTQERPWHFSIFFTTLTLHAVLSIRDGIPPQRFWWLPFVYVLWANTHIQFVMGFVLFGLTWLAMLIERLWSRDPAKNRPLKGLVLLGLACGAATLITPFHFRLYGVIWEYVTQTAVLKLVAELQPPNLLKWWNWPLILLLVPTACLIARRHLLGDLLLHTSAAVFGLRTQRDLWYAVLIAGTLLVRNVRIGPPSERRITAWQIVLVAMLALLLVRGAWAVGLSRDNTFASCHAETYPVRAAEYVREKKLPGPLFNSFDWGGYLIWALPEQPVSVDGRTNLYGEQRLERSINTWKGIDWQSDPELLRARVVIAPQKVNGQAVPLTVLLRGSDNWRLSYEDETAVVFVRVGEG